MTRLPTIAPLIDNIEARVYVVPTDLPEADGTISWDSTTLVLVQVSAADTIGTGWTYGSSACKLIVDDLLSPLLLNGDALDVPRHWQAMVRAVRNIGRQGVAGYAISALDTALWDLKSRLLGLPLYKLIGGALHTNVPIYGSGGFTSYTQEQLDLQLSGWLEQDIPRVKIKIAESWGINTRRDLSRMNQARNTIGEDKQLFVDANGGYSRKQAIQVMRSADDLNIAWFEEPVSSDDLDGLREVRNFLPMDITAGEYGFDLSYFHRMCKAEAVDCVQVDVSRCGGISEWVRVAALAAAQGLDVSGHCSPHLHVHVACATPNLRHLEWFHDHVRIENMFFDGTLSPRGGSITPIFDAPGNGFELKESDVEQYRRS